jgi:hypothetical protein
LQYHQRRIFGARRANAMIACSPANIQQWYHSYLYMLAYNFFQLCNATRSLQIFAQAMISYTSSSKARTRRWIQMCSSTAQHLPIQKTNPQPKKPRSAILKSQCKKHSFNRGYLRTVRETDSRTLRTSNRYRHLSQLVQQHQCHDSSTKHACVLEHRPDLNHVLQQCA